MSGLIFSVVSHFYILTYASSSFSNFAIPFSASDDASNAPVAAYPPIGVTNPAKGTNIAPTAAQNTTTNGTLTNAGGANVGAGTSGSSGGVVTPDTLPDLPVGTVGSSKTNNGQKVTGFAAGLMAVLGVVVTLAL